VLQAGEVDSMIKGTILFFAIVISTILICLILKTAHYLIQILGRTGINIITRLMGLILAAISVEYIIQGIKTSFLLQ